jgi:hypothetical protein
MKDVAEAQALLADASRRLLDVRARLHVAEVYGADLPPELLPRIKLVAGRMAAVLREWHETLRAAARAKALPDPEAVAAQREEDAAARLPKNGQLPLFG